MPSPRRRPAPRQAEADRNDRELLRAAREVLAEDGAHASVAAIAARAGVGIGSLYRRYPTKDDLFRHLVDLSLDHWIDVLEAATAEADAWTALSVFLTRGLESGSSGSLAPIAGTVEITPAMRAKDDRSEAMLTALVQRAHDAGVLRQDVSTSDMWALVEQLTPAPMIEQLRKRGFADQLPAAAAARRRIIAIVLDGLRAPGSPLPDAPPPKAVFDRRWETG